MLRPKLNRLWASSNANLRRDPGDAKYLQGWISEIPTFQVLNFLQNKIDNTLLSLAERGFFEWGSDVTYQLGSIVWNEADKKVYVATVASPSKTLTPNNNAAHWAASSIQISRASYDALSKAINDHIAIVSGNPHGVTAGMLNAYTKLEIDAIVAAYQSLVASHVNNRDNPHGVTAAQVGAVPITGGTYTGDVIFNGGLYFDTAKTMEVTKTGGLLLRNGDGVVGLNASGVPVAGSKSAPSPIVREDTFATVKAANQQDYAAPQPALFMPMVSDINILIGAVGSGTNSAYEPAFSSTLGAMYLGDTVGLAENIGITANPLEGAVSATLAVDIYYEDVLSDSSAPWGINLGASGNLKIFPRVNRTFYAQAGGQNTASVGPVSGQAWHRIVAVFESGYVAIYIDGVLANNSAKTTPIIPLTGNASIIQTSSNAAATKCKALVRNIRAWPQALTAKQISAL